MSTGKSFSISAGDTSNINDDRITSERLGKGSFTSEDNVHFVRGSLEYNLVNGNVFWGDKHIMEGCRSAAQLVALYYQIAGQRIEW